MAKTSNEFQGSHSSVAKYFPFLLYNASEAIIITGCTPDHREIQSNRFSIDRPAPIVGKPFRLLNLTTLPSPCRWLVVQLLQHD